ncbi:MAG TPA: permease [Streptosporangiaceae bacterium]|nr:permease [Streptosporangiaceae bacterium]
MRAVLHALSITGSMTWEITWALILGFALSAVIQAVVRRSTVVRLLGDSRPRTLALAAGLGAASSSCSYAAVALARALFRKGADFTAAALAVRFIRTGGAPMLKMMGGAPDPAGQDNGSPSG